ncbi:MAG TPA: tRNA (guanosine(37)-N1)-methyltransferase TrmD [Intrasporangium sp.]|uniref:tRNA (guanosine(37)-N1)-methyltransferase TrmD n=1 Tax=Intrasporangium sp. TaxID=1925024 RepID=UPI002B48C01B|nr:tRNA (guanosine(37)-N1)-methyltransferase TrmD [Intrasporangium sp.]HKX67187.1 tRNA (guanosine(37)-N1)-methyltransferase TrmD [Intrasporangium sp.]
MRIDVITIFPEYLQPLELSLIGKARQEGLLTVATHDLRDFTHDRHRTVDDTPYGGGAGMVMKPGPWAEALDHVLAQSEPGARPHLIVPGPGGTRFTQAMARALAAEPWLAFACGRYEGIDERVHDHAREDLRLEVSVVSLGDYVLNGGEVAVLAMVEAIARLLPGVVGNAESLVEESHEDGLLEYPIYTKPRVWNGRAVPDVLLSGDHAAIAAWRHAQRLARTAARRPDLLHPSQVAVPGEPDVDVALLAPADVPELFTLALAAAADEARVTDALDLPELSVSVDDVTEGVSTRTWVARKAGRLVGSVRTELCGDELRISQLLLAPDLRGGALEAHLLRLAEQSAPSGIRTFSLEADARSLERMRTYRKAGYRRASREPEIAGRVSLVKRRRAG